MAKSQKQSAAKQAASPANNTDNLQHSEHHADGPQAKQHGAKARRTADQAAGATQDADTQQTTHAKQTHTHFGYQQVPLDEKVEKVKGVFSSVAKKYDLMNDLMSLGIHRLWKRCAISRLDLRPGQRVLDLAGGSGDLALKIAPKIQPAGHVMLSDINPDMLEVGKNRVLDAGQFNHISCQQANAEQLPFAEHEFDRIIISFGLRNVTDKAAALSSMYRCLKPGGKLVILEFSKPILPLLDKIYDQYSFKILPWLGELIAGDAASYRYLAESIRMHPGQDTLGDMLQTAGFEDCLYQNLSGGIVAIHWGYKY